MTDQRIHKWFWRATGNMSLQEFMLLMSCGKHIPNIYYFDSQSRSAVQFSPGLLAWPVEYLLAFHSPKHVFGGRTRPSLRALNAWEHRLCWKLALQGSTPNPWNFLSGPNRFTRHYPLKYSNQVENFFQDMSSSVFFQEVLRIRSRTSRCKALLGTGATDGFKKLTRMAVSLWLKNICSENWIFTYFVEWAYYVLQTEFVHLTSAVQWYSRLPDFLIREGPEQKQFLDAMFKSLQKRYCRAFRKLRYTVKTHKADGAPETKGKRTWEWIWLEYDRFPLGNTIFKDYVSFREGVS